MGWGSTPSRGSDFFILATACRVTLGPTQPSLPWVPVTLPGDKAVGE